MKKYIFSVFVFLTSVLAFAQTPKEEAEVLVHQFASKVEKSRMTLDYSFILYDQTRLTGKGKVVMQDQAFKLSTGGLDIYCNGTDRWVVDQEAQEVAVEPVDTEAVDVMTNPMALFTDLDVMFNFSPMQEGIFQKQPARYSILSAKEPFEIRLMKLYFRGTEPIGLLVTMADDRVLEIIFNQLTFSKMGPLSDFQLKTEELSDDWIVNDLR